MSYDKLKTKIEATQFVKNAIDDGTFYTTKHASSAVNSSQPASAFMSTFNPHYEDPDKMKEFLDSNEYSVSACFDKKYNSYSYLFYPQGTSLSKTGDTYCRGSVTPDSDNDCILAVSGFQQGIHGYPVSLSAIQNELNTRYETEELK